MLNTLLRLLIAATSHESNNKQQNYRSDDRCHQRAKGANGNPAHQSHKPSSQKSTDNTNDEVDDEARGVASYNQIGKPARRKPN